MDTIIRVPEIFLEVYKHAKDVMELVVKGLLKVADVPVQKMNLRGHLYVLVTLSRPASQDEINSYIEAITKQGLIVKKVQDKSDVLEVSLRVPLEIARKRMQGYSLILKRFADFADEQALAEAPRPLYVSQVSLGEPSLPEIVVPVVVGRVGQKSRLKKPPLPPKEVPPRPETTDQAIQRLKDMARCGLKYYIMPRDEECLVKVFLRGTQSDVEEAHALFTVWGVVFSNSNNDDSGKVVLLV